MSSPEATRYLADALERIAGHLAVHSAKLAASDGRVTIKRADMEQAWNAFLRPRQVVTWTADELRSLIERLETRARETASNLVADAPPPSDRRRGQAR
jgi:hypothetical protein